MHGDTRRQSRTEVVGTHSRVRQDSERYEGKPLYEATIALLEVLNAVISLGFLLYACALA